MKSDKEHFENYSKFKISIAKLLKYPKDTKVLNDIKNLLETLSPDLVQRSQRALLAAVAHIFTNRTSYNENTRILMTEILHNLFEKSSIDNLLLFMNVYGYLLVEIFDDRSCKIRSISEEYKLKIMECMKTIMKSVSSDIVLELYQPVYARRLSSMVYVARELASTEQMRKLKISAIQCIMAVAKVLDDEDFKDIVVRHEVLKMFIYLLPGIATGLVSIATEDEKINHKVPAEAVKAWGRIVTLLMQNYESPTQRPKSSIQDLKILIENGGLTGKSDAQGENCDDSKKSNEKFEFTPNWYKKTDENLTILAIKLSKLVHHGHVKVKHELLNMCQLVLANCLMTMPVCSAVLVEIIIVLIQDENEEVSERSREFLENFAEKFDSEDLSTLFNYLQDNFYKHLSEVPRIFNSLDLPKQSYSLNVIYGFLTVFGRDRLNEVLLTGNNLEILLMTLIHISKLERSKTGLFEDYSNKDINLIENSNITWKNFQLFTDKKLQLQLEKLCQLLAFNETFPLVTDFLLDHFISVPSHRKNTTYILNEVISGCKYNEENRTFVMNVLNTYIDCNYLQIPLRVNDFGVEQSLAEVQDNAIQVCLLIEGIGKIALIMGKCFKQCLFKVMYLLLEKAGNDHVLVRKAALIALENVAKSCEYKSIAEMINQNIDYFAFHIDKKLNRSDNKDEVLNVFSVIINYSSLCTLHYISDIIQEVMVQSCDKFKERYADNYLRIFKIFLLSLWKWLGIVTKMDKIKCKAQKIEEIEHFQVTGAKTEIENDFSDDITGKSAQELFEEDMKKSQEELQKEIEEPEVEEYKKPEPPIHIKLTVDIISRSLHFLPSKNRTRKLLVLEVLSLGLEAIKDWENELLPMVHQIWSPLSQRFKEMDDPLVFNYSFCLLMTMARHAREFIKIRTEKEVFPSINQVLDKLSKESYLKDKGSAYRYSQYYKLQLVILENLGVMMAYLDVQEKIFLDTSEVVFKYLSDKQPIFLQSAAIRFFKQIYHYDPPTVKKVFEKCLENFKSDEFKKNVAQCNVF